LKFGSTLFQNAPKERGVQHFDFEEDQNAYGSELVFVFGRINGKGVTLAALSF